MKRTLPFIGGARDGEYLPVENPNMSPYIGVYPSGQMESVFNTNRFHSSVEYDSRYRRGKFATRSGGLWIFYVLEGLTDDEAIEKLMTNYSPETE